MYVCMYVCMYVYTYIYIYILQMEMETGERHGRPGRHGHEDRRRLHRHPGAISDIIIAIVIICVIVIVIIVIVMAIIVMVIRFASPAPLALSQAARIPLSRRKGK